MRKSPQKWINWSTWTVNDTQSTHLFCFLAFFPEVRCDISTLCPAPRDVASDCIVLLWVKDQRSIVVNYVPYIPVQSCYFNWPKLKQDWIMFLDENRVDSLDMLIINFFFFQFLFHSIFLWKRLNQLPFHKFMQYYFGID